MFRSFGDASLWRIKWGMGLFISIAGRSWDHFFDAAFPAITAFFNGTGFEYYNSIIANRINENGGIKNHLPELKESFDKGQTVVRVPERVKAEPGTKKITCL
jgi:hypothetical protein